MKAYSEDLRERVLKAVDQGIPRKEVVRLFGVSLASIKRYLKRRRDTGNIAPKPIPGYPPTKRAPLQAKLQAQLEAQPDATLQEHCAAFLVFASPTINAKAVRVDFCEPISLFLASLSKSKESNINQEINKFIKVFKLR